MEVEPPLETEKEQWQTERMRVLDEWCEIELKGADALKMDVTHHEPGSPIGATAPETPLQDLYPLLAGPTAAATSSSMTSPDDDVATTDLPETGQSDGRSTFDRLLDICLCRPVKCQLSPLAYTHKGLIVKLAQMPYDNANGTHWLLLSDYFHNVHNSLVTSSSSSAPPPPPRRIGAHWVSVGFQGPTPETDFRGCGVLGLLQMHSFTQRIPPNILKSIVLLATTEPNDFPLAVVSINITSIILTQLKKGALDSFGSETEGLYPFFSALHAASMAKFCSLYKSQKCTLAQTQSIFSEITRQLEKSPLPLLMLLNPNNDELINTLL